MKVVILMAGEGNRFREVGITTPKPLIQCNGRSILEWTTRSLPAINHYGELGNSGFNETALYFAVREEHRATGIDVYLRTVYGQHINVVWFDKTTRGNLETTLRVVDQMTDLTSPLLVLDCDNKYDGDGLLDDALTIIDFIPNSMGVTYFDPIDDSSKWAFAVLDDVDEVTEIVEKDPTALARGGKPLIGTFWFYSASQFQAYATEIIENRQRTGPVGKEEFFISQVPSLHASRNLPTYGYKVTNVDPLGTPEDVDIYLTKVMQ